MNTTKLTLSADPAVIASAKKMAARQHTSVSGMFVRFIRAMQGAKPGAVGPITTRASGLVRLPKGKADRRLVEDALTERYDADR